MDTLITAAKQPQPSSCTVTQSGSLCECNAPDPSRWNPASSLQAKTDLSTENPAQPYPEMAALPAVEINWPRLIHRAANVGVGIGSTVIAGGIYAGRPEVVLGGVLIVAASLLVKELVGDKKPT